MMRADMIALLEPLVDDGFLAEGFHPTHSFADCGQIDAVAWFEGDISFLRGRWSVLCRIKKQARPKLGSPGRKCLRIYRPSSVNDCSPEY